MPTTSCKRFGRSIRGLAGSTPPLSIVRHSATPATAFWNRAATSAGSTPGRRRVRAAWTLSIRTRCCSVSRWRPTTESARRICRRSGTRGCREGLWLHWDGNNNKVTERNKSAAIGAGASEDSLDLDAMKRVEDWIWDLSRRPNFRPTAWIRRSPSGQGAFQQHCARATRSAAKGRADGELAAIGTDPERLNSFTPELAVKMNTIGSGKPWKFSHFRKTAGYARCRSTESGYAPLPAQWQRSDFARSAERAGSAAGGVLARLRRVRFRQGRVRLQRAEAERAGFRYDTSVRGNGRQGHTYGDRSERNCETGTARIPQNALRPRAARRVN